MLSFAVRCLMCIAALVVSSRPLSAQKNWIDPRVGSEIDSLERAYFNIFPNVDNFATAVGAEDPSGSIRFMITRTDGSIDTSISISRSVDQDLHQYFGQYEKLFQGESIQIDWAALRTVIRPSKPFRDNPIVLTVTTMDGKIISGPLLYVNDSVLAIGSSDHTGSFAEVDSTAYILRPRDIEYIEDNYSTVSRFISSVYVPVKGNDTMYRQYALPRVRNYTRYFSSTSPELRNRVAKEIYRPRSTGDLPMSMVEIESETGRKYLHLQLTYAMASEKLPAYFPMGSKENPLSWAKVTVPDQGYFQISLEYDLLNRIRIGGRYSFHALPLVSRDTFSIYERFSGDEAFATLSYVVLSRDNWLQGPWTRFEMNAGSALAVQWGEVDTRMSAKSQLQPEPYGKYIVTRQTLVGIAIFTNLTYYLTDYVSIGMGATHKFMPRMQVPLQELYNPRFGNLIQAFPDHSFSVNSTDALLSISIHY